SSVTCPLALHDALPICHIAQLLSADEGKTPLQRRLAQFGRRLALVVLALCAMLFAIGWLRGEPPVTMFLTAVSLAVAAIPEALRSEEHTSELQSRENLV